MNRIFITALSIMLPCMLYAQSQPQYRVKTIKKDVMTFRDGWQKFAYATYYYTGGRQGTMDINVVKTLGVNNNSFLTMNPSMQYDSVYIDSVHTSLTGVRNYRIYQQLTQQNLMPERVCYNNVPLGTATFSFKETYTYNNGLITALTKDYPTGATTTEYRYNNGQLDSMLVVYKPGNTKTTTTFTYNGNNLLNTALTFDWKGMLTDSVFYEYDGNNKLSKQTKMVWFGNVLDTLNRIEYTYDNNGNIIEEYTIQIPNSSYWYLRPWQRIFYTYDASQKLIEEMIMGDRHRDGKKLDTTDKRSYKYNTQSLITEVKMQKWDPDSANWIYSFDTMQYSQFYNASSHIMTIDYEMYWPTSVAQTSVKEPAVKLYPSPSSDFIRVEAVWKEERAFDAMICDMQGRVIRQWKEPANRFYTRTIPIPELPAGIYILKMQCGDEAFSKQFVKQ